MHHVNITFATALLLSMLLAPVAPGCPPGSTFDAGLEGYVPFDTSCTLIPTTGYVEVIDDDSSWVWIRAGANMHGDWSCCGSVSMDVLGDVNSLIEYPAQMEIDGPAGYATYTFDVNDVVAGQWRTLSVDLDASLWSVSGDFDAILADVDDFWIRLDLTDAAADTPSNPLEVNGLDNVLVAEDACPADIAPPGGDQLINVSDLLEVLGSWNLADADTNCDGITDVTDLLRVLADWGDC